MLSVIAFRQCRSMPPKLTEEVVQQIADAAFADRRTVALRLLGLKLKTPLIEKRVDAAIASVLGSGARQRTAEAARSKATA